MAEQRIDYFQDRQREPDPEVSSRNKKRWRQEISAKGVILGAFQASCRKYLIENNNLGIMFESSSGAIHSTPSAGHLN
jgi:hypothetical protein